jgi:hypothetical protein
MVCRPVTGAAVLGPAGTSGVSGLWVLGALQHRPVRGVRRQLLHPCTGRDWRAMLNLQDAKAVVVVVGSPTVVGSVRALIRGSHPDASSTRQCARSSRACCAIASALRCARSCWSRCVSPRRCSHSPSRLTATPAAPEVSQCSRTQCNPATTSPRGPAASPAGLAIPPAGQRPPPTPAARRPATSRWPGPWLLEDGSGQPVSDRDSPRNPRTCHPDRAWLHPARDKSALRHRAVKELRQIMLKVTTRGAGFRGCRESIDSRHPKCSSSQPSPTTTGPSTTRGRPCPLTRRVRVDLPRRSGGDEQADAEGQQPG